MLSESLGREGSNGPLVSVIIPTYNCGKYISEALLSVFSQIYERLEIIVVDDGSTDDTREVLGPYLGKITYVYQKNEGVSSARNVGIRHARGELVAFLDSDDYWYPAKLLRQVESFKKYPKGGLYFTDHVEFDESGVISGSGFGDKVHGWLNNHNDGSEDVVFGSIYEELLRGNIIHSSSVIVSRDALEEVGGFDEAFKVSQDYDLWLRISKKYPVVCVNSVLCGYRVRSEGLSGSMEIREIRWIQEWIAVLEKHRRKHMIPDELHGLARTVLSQRYWRLGWLLFKGNRFREARALFLRSMRYRLFSGSQLVYFGACYLPMTVVDGLRRLKRQHAGGK